MAKAPKKQKKKDVRYPGYESYGVKKDVRPRKGNSLGERNQTNRQGMAGLRAGKQPAPAHNTGRVSSSARDLIRGGAAASAAKQAGTYSSKKSKAGGQKKGPHTGRTRASGRSGRLL